MKGPVKINWAVFTAGTGRLSIGLTSREGRVGFHLHLTENEAQRFFAFVAGPPRASSSPVREIKLELIPRPRVPAPR